MTQSKIIIATHGGAFHADDAFGVSVLLTLEPSASVMRTRNLNKIAQATYAVDVGGEWAPEQGRFDHHQKGFARTRADGTKYAAAGLVWERLGEAYVAALVPELKPAEVTRVAQTLDRELVRHIDMTDTGEGYSAEGQFGLSLLLANLNLTRLEEKRETWHPDKSLSEEQHRNEQQHARFMQAVNICQQFLERLTLQLADEVLSESEVRQATRHFDGRVLVLEETGLSWQKVVVEEMPDVLYVVFPDRADGGHMLQAVPTEVGGFTSRKRLPEQWAGLRFQDLAAVTHVGSSVFCHNERFIAAAGTQADALELAQLALADPQ